MKRSSFLKSLFGAAIAPSAAIKALSSVSPTVIPIEPIRKIAGPAVWHHIPNEMLSDIPYLQSFLNSIYNPDTSTIKEAVYSDGGWTEISNDDKFS